MKIKSLLISLTFLSIHNTFCQSRSYLTSGGEMIFSFANINDNGRSESSLMRWAPVFNPQFMANKDYNRKFGVFSGITISNVGYIYDNYVDKTKNNTVFKKKFRSYNVGIPLGIKFGNLDKVFVFTGYEVEFPFLYKEKTFDGSDKIQKTTGWFSKREEWIQHGFFIGVQMKSGLNLKFKYYLSEFHNRDYIDGSGNKPYDGLKSNIFYFSLGSFFSLTNPPSTKHNPVTPTTEINQYNSAN